MKIVVVGGGIIGRSVAWRAARGGADVVLIDSRLAQAASAVAAGLLIPAGGRISLHHLALRRRSAELYPQFVAALEEESGLECGYHAFGTLTVAYAPGADNSLDGLAGCLRGLGVAVERLSQEECRSREPQLSSEVAGGFYTADHQVDPEKMMIALEAACEKSGVTRVEERVVRVATHEVTLERGDTLPADRVVVASGAWIRKLLSVPVFPVKGEVIHLAAPPGLLRHNLVLRGEDLYVANRGDGRLVVGATEEEVGFEASVTATLALKKKIDRLLPALAACPVRETRVGFRPKVGDGLPVLGDHQGIVVAGGHYRNGILLAPVTAEVLTDYLLRGRIDPLMEPFHPTRDMRDRKDRV